MQCCCCGNLPSKYCRRCYSGRVQAKYEYDTAFRDQRLFAWNECRNQRKLSRCSVILEIIHLSVNLWILNFPSILFVKYFINIFSTLKLYFKLECHHFPSGFTQFSCMISLQACMAGIVFAKFTKPTMRAETILFSKNALITVRNGSMYLVCRIADLR